MNKVVDAILGRFSCWDYTPQDLTEDELSILAKVALASPSYFNKQPWHISIVTKKELIEGLNIEALEMLKDHKEIYNKVVSKGSKLVYNAPCIVVVSSNSINSYSHIDCGIVIQNIALAAYSMGLASNISSTASLPINGPNKSMWYDILQIPPNYKQVITILVGHPNINKKPHSIDINKISWID